MIAGGVVDEASGAGRVAVGVAAGAAIGMIFTAFHRWDARFWIRALVEAGAIGAILVGFGLWAIGVEFGTGGGTEIPKQSAPDPETRRALAQQFTPVLRLSRSPRELFVPIGRPAYVALTQLEIRTGNVDRLKPGHPTIESLPTSGCTEIPGCFYILDVVGAEPRPPAQSALAYHALQEQALNHGAMRLVYDHVSRYDKTGDYAVQYWFLYFFNYRLNEHESDWEQITIHLDPDKRPVNAYYSAHVCGHIRDWNKVEKVPADSDHPVDHVANGSHANYFKSGQHKVALKKRKLGGNRTLCTFERLIKDVANGRATEDLRLGRDYELRELTGPVFSGSYGSGNYVFGKRKPDLLTDPRKRREWKHPLEQLLKP